MSLTHSSGPFMINPDSPHTILDADGITIAICLASRIGGDRALANATLLAGSWDLLQACNDAHGAALINALTVQQLATGEQGEDDVREARNFAERLGNLIRRCQGRS